MRKRLCSLLGVVGVLMGGWSGWGQETERRWALVIGIDQYQSPLIAPLQCAVRDAKEFARILREQAGFPEENVFLLTSDASYAEGQPTAANILFRLSWLKENVRPEDLFIFYYSGHGMTEGKKGYLLPVDTDPRTVQTRSRTCLALEEVGRELEAIPARKKLLFVDACRSELEGARGVGEGTRNVLTEEFTRNLVLRARTVGPTDVQATFFSCSEGEKAWEWRRQGHGFFTYFLLQGLRGEAKDSLGRVTPAALAAYLTRTVPEAVHRELGQRQQPWPKMEGPGVTELVLSPPAGVLCVNSQPWGLVYLNGEKVGETPLRIDGLPAGTYVLRVTRIRYRAVEQTIMLKAGDFLTVGVRLEKIEE